MDDISPFDVKMASDIKNWADRYGRCLETKGGATTDQYEKFIITSQYSIEQIWTDEETRDAMNRRFEVIHMI